MDLTSRWKAAVEQALGVVLTIADENSYSAEKVTGFARPSALPDPTVTRACTTVQPERSQTDCGSGEKPASVRLALQ